jgi:hypothetical protein
METSRHFRKKERECVKCNIDELESNCENKNFREVHRDINKFKKVYQPKTNLV